MKAFKQFSSFIILALVVVALAFFTGAFTEAGHRGFSLFGQILLWGYVLALLGSLWPVLELISNIKRADGLSQRSKLRLKMAEMFENYKRPGMTRRCLAFTRDVLVVFFLVHAGIVWLAIGYTIAILLGRAALDEAANVRDEVVAELG